MEDSYLCHHGIKGMKWGVIRKRRNTSDSAPLSKRAVRRMSNSDLTENLVRLEKEVRYKDLVSRSKADNKYIEYLFSGVMEGSRNVIRKNTENVLEDVLDHSGDVLISTLKKWAK